MATMMNTSRRFEGIKGPLDPNVPGPGEYTHAHNTMAERRPVTNTKTSLSVSKRLAHTDLDVRPVPVSESGVFRDELAAELAEAEADATLATKSVVSGAHARPRPVIGTRQLRPVNVPVLPDVVGGPGKHLGPTLPGDMAKPLRKVTTRAAAGFGRTKRHDILHQVRVLGGGHDGPGPAGYSVVPPAAWNARPRGVQEDDSTKELDETLRADGKGRHTRTKRLTVANKTGAAADPYAYIYDVPDRVPSTAELRKPPKRATVPRYPAAGPGYNDMASTTSDFDRITRRSARRGRRTTGRRSLATTAPAGAVGRHDHGRAGGGGDGYGSSSLTATATATASSSSSDSDGDAYGARGLSRSRALPSSTARAATAPAPRLDADDGPLAKALAMASTTPSVALSDAAEVRAAADRHAARRRRRRHRQHRCHPASFKPRDTGFGRATLAPGPGTFDVEAATSWVKPSANARTTRTLRAASGIRMKPVLQAARTASPSTALHQSSVWSASGRPTSSMMAAPRAAASVASSISPSVVDVGGQQRLEELLFRSHRYPTLTGLPPHARAASPSLPPSRPVSSALPTGDLATESSVLSVSCPPPLAPDELPSPPPADSAAAAFGAELLRLQYAGNVEAVKLALEMGMGGQRARHLRTLAKHKGAKDTSPRNAPQPPRDRRPRRRVPEPPAPKMSPPTATAAVSKPTPTPATTTAPAAGGGGGGDGGGGDVVSDAEDGATPLAVSAATSDADGGALEESAASKSAPDAALGDSLAASDLGASGASSGGLGSVDGGASGVGDSVAGSGDDSDGAPVDLI